MFIKCLRIVLVLDHFGQQRSNIYPKRYKACQDKSFELELDLDSNTNLNSVSPVGYSCVNIENADSHWITPHIFFVSLSTL